MQKFENIQALIIDMDGVLWHGQHPLPGLSNFFAALRELDLPLILATNNASLTPKQYVAKLAGMGVRIGRHEILTSAMATAAFLAESNKPDNTRVFVIGEEGAREPLLEHGFRLCDNLDFAARTNPTVDLVVCGLDRHLTWKKLSMATLHIRAGAQLIATNGDTSLPTEHGITIGNGAILAALQAATGVVATTIGKPEPIMYQQAIKQLGHTAEKTIAIGDRLDTDILGAVRANMRSILVLTGISKLEDLATSNFQPTWVMPDITAVTAALLKLKI